MNVNMVYPPRPKGRGRVVALHCSGAGASQWNYLAEALGGGYELLAPEHFGPWTGERPFCGEPSQFDPSCRGDDG